MTTQRSLRRAYSAIVVLLLLASAAFAQDFEVYRPQIDALLADEAVAAIELGDRWRTVEPGQMQVSWPDADVKCLLIGAKGDSRDGYAVIDEAAQQVVGLVGPVPAPPVPMDEMPPDEAEQVARQFAQRHLLELFADGGEVVVSVAEAITPLGARMVRLQRTVAGVEVPTVADVGVRVYDGKIVHWREHHVPLDAALALPGELTLEQARAIAAENRPYEKHLPVFWFDEAHRVIVTAEGQRNVWDLWAEVKQTTTPENRLEFLAHWQIDAGSGEVLLSEGHSPGKEPDLLARYYAAGGEHTSPDFGRPLPEPMVEDSQPTWTPDGLLFLSDRARTGYPSWGSWPRGLFAINADGSGLRCLRAEASGAPAISPDGTRMLLKDEDGLHVIPLAGGDELLIPRGEGAEGYVHAGWLDDETLVADFGSDTGGGSLVTVDLTQAEPAPQPTGITHKLDESFAAFLPMADGTLLYSYYSYRDGNPWDLMRVDLSAAEPQPQVICANPQEGRGIQLLADGRVLLRDTREMGAASPMYVVDLKTGEAEKWEVPALTDPISGDRLRPGGLVFSPDGQRLAFGAQVIDQERTKAPAALIFTANADGSDVQPLTPWEDALVPMAE